MLAGPAVISYDEVAERAASRSGGAVAIVAVDGPAGSGKSTFATRLAGGRDATILEIDDFLSWYDIESWWPRFLVEALDPLAAGRPARFQARAWDEDLLGSSLGPWRELAPASLLIVEGIGASRQAVAARLGTVVWVEAGRARRLDRGVERDGPELRDEWLDFMRIEEEFFARDGTRSRADYVVEGDPAVPHDPAREFIGIPPAGR